MKKRLSKSDVKVKKLIIKNLRKFVATQKKQIQTNREHSQKRERRQLTLKKMNKEIRRRNALSNAATPRKKKFHGHEFV